MKISYAFPSSPNLASWRYRIKIPGDELSKLGHEVSEGIDGDIVYFAKHFDADDLEIAEECKNIGKKVVFDCCDDHFSNTIGHHYRRMCSLADAVTCPTETMREIIYAETWHEATVISDPYEYPLAEPKRPGPKLFWFGHQSNIGTLTGLNLNGYKLGIITGDMWSYENMLKGFEQTDLVIIPTNSNKQYKSPNRMVESIRQGHYVIAGQMPAYECYGMWLGDIKQGCDWAIENPEKALELIYEAQEIVHEKHSPQVIGAEWEMLLKSL